METTLKQRIARYTEAKRFLEEHPEHKEMLERKIKEAEAGIIQYVTSDSFIHQLDYVNL